MTTLDGEEEGTKVELNLIEAPVVMLHEGAAYVLIDSKACVLRQAGVEAVGTQLSGTATGTVTTVNGLPALDVEANELTATEAQPPTAYGLNLTSSNGSYGKLGGVFKTFESKPYFILASPSQATNDQGRFSVFQEASKVEVSDVFGIGFADKAPYEGGRVYNSGPTGLMVQTDGQPTFWPIQVPAAYDYYFETRTTGPDYGNNIVVADAEGVSVTINKAYSSNVVQAVCLPFDYQFVYGEREANKVWEYTEAKNGVMVFTQTKQDKVITAGTPFLFQPYTSFPNGMYGVNTKTYADVNLVAEPKTVAHGDYVLTANYAVRQMETDETELRLSYDSQAETMAYSLQVPELGKEALTGLSWYVKVPEMSEVKIWIEGVQEFGNEVITGIDEQNAAPATKAAAVYDLQGRRLTATPAGKGIFVVNGRKVVR